MCVRDGISWGPFIKQITEEEYNVVGGMVWGWCNSDMKSALDRPLIHKVYTYTVCKEGRSMGFKVGKGDSYR